MATLYLTDGRPFQVDDADEARVAAYRWYAGGSRHRYAARSAYSQGQKTTLYLHRWLLEAGPGEQVDHIDGNTLDNRRANLRLCTRKENSRNHPGRPNQRRSRYKGVEYRTDGVRRRPWYAGARVDGRIVCFGFYLTEEEAALAYNAGVSRLYGEFAWLNVVMES